MVVSVVIAAFLVVLCLLINCVVVRWKKSRKTEIFKTEGSNEKDPQSVSEFTSTVDGNKETSSRVLKCDDIHTLIPQEQGTPINLVYVENIV